MVYGEQYSNEGSVVLCVGARGRALRGLQKEITVTFQSYALLDVHRP